MSTHGTVMAVAGDDWEIAATLIDENGAPFDLTNAQVTWTLLDLRGQRVIDSSEVSVSIDSPATTGECTVLVPSTVTTRLASGAYSDALRLVLGGVTSTLLTGQWSVMADPFAATAAPAGKTRVPLKIVA
jgi:hypothetical protein